ncbi:glycosyltransferase family 2 protein [Natronococcus jeotgali]|uniref:Family 2 glycosyl transferase n=1 Tax=Natronococcus jeotgali DSM 18795 TaxID=1227498 RepID=L9XTQ3_9EURY|nr:glycosyltransferase family 2 protein [Natronococcus jeotgali]ELY64781.1 family 2 glycosyl transferase [Natronococcus jeotgali DSM 18795]
MYRGHTVGVIVPAYNEESHVGEVLATVPEFVDRIYAVDDRSTDDTWEIIRECAAASRRVTDDEPLDSEGEFGPEIRASVADGGRVGETEIVPIRHEENQGAGGALRTGYVRGRKDGMDIVATMDADGQMDPEQLPRLLEPIVEDVADYAKGNRLGDRESRQEMPPFRLFGNWLLTQLTKIASGYWTLQDPQNGYTAISQEALSAVDIESLPADHEYPNDLLVRLNIADMRVADVSMPAMYDDEESTIEYRRFVPVTSVTLLRGFLRRMYTQLSDDRLDPAAIGYVAGLVSLAGALTSAIGIGSSLLKGEASARDLSGIASAFATSAVAFLIAMGIDAVNNAENGVRR